MKNFRTILAALLMLCCATLSAHDFEVEGIYYNILSEEDRTVEVTYKGSYSGEYFEYSGNVAIPANVTYEGTTYSVTTIGNNAFDYCNSLTSIEIPNSVTTIGVLTFGNCNGLTSITIPNSVTSIGDYAFFCCYSLTSIEIPNSVTTIGYGAFSGCGLTSIEIPNSVTTIGDGAFSSCNGLTSIEIPNSVTTIGESAFWGCYSLTSIEIPNSVTTIGKKAFCFCTGLTSIEIPNSVTTIGDNAFSNCNYLTSIEIPNSVTTIGYGAFGNCNGLTSIVVAEDNTIYDSREDCNAIIETATNTLITGCKNTVIPNSVTTIGVNAFIYCTSLTSIEISNSVTTIGYGAFGGCGLTSIEIPNSVTTIGDYAFGDCTGLTSIEIPNSVTTIGYGAFSGCGLTSIVVAEDNTIYDSREHCNAIIETATNTLISGCKNTVIPNSVTTIGDYSFYTCDGLTSIEIPNSVTTIGESAFNSCNSLTSIEIPNSVTTIGESAFWGCSGLTSITIPNSVTTIGNGAFDYCEGLTSVTSLIPADKLFSIDSSVFNGVDKNACTLYVPYGAKETYAATDGWNEFTNIVELVAEQFELTVSAAKYATLYLDYNATIPEGVEVYTANTVDGNRLMMQEVTGTLPAKTGVIVRAEQGTYTFEQTFEKVDAIESNLLRGSVKDVYITPAKDAKYYVLSMKDGVVGMYEDALTGGTFKNNAHKAYLVLGVKDLGIYDEEVDTENPGMQLSNSYYFDFSGTTAIEPVVNGVEDNIYYDLSGRRVENPTQGIYIVNGKKVLVK